MGIKQAPAELFIQLEIGFLTPFNGKELCKTVVCFPQGSCAGFL
jgi:hypothetical protein